MSRVAARDVAHRVTSDGHGDLIFFKFGETRVVGVHDRVDHPDLAAGTVVHGIRLRPVATATAFGVDARQLRNRSISTDQLEAASLVGLTFDAVLQTPFGLWALVLSVVAYLVGTFQRSVLRAAWWIPVATAVAATLASVILYVLIGQLLGQQFRSANLPMILLVTSVMNGLLSPVMLRAMHWALPQERSPSGLLAR